MAKEVKYGKDAVNSVVEGIFKVSGIVKTTLGPKGRNVLVRDGISLPTITNDGVTIAKSIQLKDNIEDAGAALIISSANKTNEIAGDGTTTTTVLAAELIEAGFKLLENTNINPVQIQKEMIEAGNEVSDYLKSIAINVSDKDSLQRIATISSGNEETGALIAKAFEQAGEFGNVVVENSKFGIDALTTIEGMRLPNGTINQYLLSDLGKQVSEVQDVSVLISKDKIDSINEIAPVLDKIVKEGRRLLIICEDMSFEPLNALVMNKARGAINVNVIRLPGFGEIKNLMVEDICIATGAKAICRDDGNYVQDFNLSWLGELKEVKVGMDETILKFKDISNNEIDLLAQRTSRVKELIEQLENLPIDKDKTQYERRIANLLGGLSVIEVGGNSEVEMKDKMLRIEDAINSVRAALEEGIVQGGGISFLTAFKHFNKTEPELGYPKGKELVYQSLLAVLRTIAENAGLKAQEIVDYCYDNEIGYNALTEEYENLLETGVINAVKVDRYCVLNAVSVASTVITMGGCVIEENQKDQNVLQLQGPIQGVNMI